MTPLHGNEIISTKPMPSRAYMIFSLVCCFVVYCVLSPALCDIFDTPMAQYILFVLKVPLNSK